MNKLIMYPLVIIVFCAVLSQLILYEGSSTYNPDFTSTAGITLNGTSSFKNPIPRFDWFNPTTWYTFAIGGLRPEDVNGTYTVDPMIIGITFGGIVALLIGFIAVAVLAGITVFGSGISESAQNVIYKSVFFYTIWGIFSILATSGIVSIPIFGTVIYIFLTLCYVIGVQSQINTHEG